MSPTPPVAPLLERIGRQLQERLPALDGRDTLMIGIHTGGAWIAEALHKQLELNGPLGTLDISFYRDDFSRIGMHPQVKPSQLPTDIDGRHIILVDDVLQSGRTVRAALNEIFDYGRPASVTLAVLVERGGRELPICADVVGERLELADGQIKLNGPDELSLVIKEGEDA